MPPLVHIIIYNGAIILQTMEETDKKRTFKITYSELNEKTATIVAADAIDAYKRFLQAQTDKLKARVIRIDEM